MVRKRLIYLLLFAGVVMMGGCLRQPTVSSDSASLMDHHEAVEEPTREPTSPVQDESLGMEEIVETSTPMPVEDVVEKDQILYGLTNQNLDGNRWVRGHGRLPEVEPLDIALNGIPIWVVGAELGGGSIWVVSLEKIITLTTVIDGN